MHCTIGDNSVDNPDILQRTVGADTNAVRLLRSGAWYGMDISMVLNSLARDKNTALQITRMQQCCPPMPCHKEVFAYLDQWHAAHHLAEVVLVLVFDGRRYPHKLSAQ